MNRFLTQLDTLIEAGAIDEDVFAQTGCCTYQPKHYKGVAFLNKEEMEKKIDACSLLICHAGSSSMMQGMKRGKKVIAVPRKAEYGEHVDDHQFELASTFCQAGYLLMAGDTSDLGERIERSGSFVPKSYISSTNAYIELLTSIIG